MKSKQILDVQQMQHLQELGVDTSNASMLYCELYFEKPILVESKHRFEKEENAIVLDGVRDSVIYCKEVTPAYTLQDVLDKLPTEIVLHKTRCWLSIDFVEGLVEYYSEDYNEVREHMRVELFHKDKPLIDAAYSMLCWCIENKFVETNKNE